MLLPPGSPQALKALVSKDRGIEHGAMSTKGEKFHNNDLLSHNSNLSSQIQRITQYGVKQSHFRKMTT